MNLIPFKRREARRHWICVRRWIAACAAYGAFLVAALTGAKILWGTPNRTVAGELDRMNKQIEEYKSAISLLRPQLITALTTLAANKSVGTQPDWSLLLSMLASLLGDDAVLVSCTLDPVARLESDPDAERYTMRVSGFGTSQTQVQNFVLRLEQTGFFASVELIETRKESFMDSQAVAFKIQCSLDELAGANREADR